VAELDLGDGSPDAITKGVSSYLTSSGTNVGTALSTFILGLIASLWYGTVEIVNAVVGFVTTPFSKGGEAVGKLIEGILTEPIGILEKTAQASATAISAEFGWLSFLVGVAVLLGAMYMVVQYLEQPETGDTFVGLPFDTPDVGPFEIGVTEEGEDEADE